MNSFRSKRFQHPSSRMARVLVAALLSLVPAGSVCASAWIERISGNAGDVVITRGGDMIAASEMTRLEAGDRVSVSGETGVRILLGDGTLRELGKGRQTFTVPGDGDKASLFGNLMNEAKSLLSSSTSRTEAVSALTRGKGDRTAFVPQPAEQNLFYEAEGELAVAWAGAQAPFTVSLIDDGSGKEVAGGKDIAAHEFKLSLNGVARGDYRLLVRAQAPGAFSEALVTLVGPEDLPPELQELYDFGLDKRVQARFLIARSFKLPEWRMFAYSLAVRHDLQQEKSLLAGTR